jgi:hypothetical protein
MQLTQLRLGFDRQFCQHDNNLHSKDSDYSSGNDSRRRRPVPISELKSSKCQINHWKHVLLPSRFQLDAIYIIPSRPDGCPELAHEQYCGGVLYPSSNFSNRKSCEQQSHPLNEPPPSQLSWSCCAICPIQCWLGELLDHQQPRSECYEHNRLCLCYRNIH